MKATRILHCTLFLVALISSSALAQKAVRLEIPEIGKKTLLNGMEFLFLEGDPGRIPFVLMVENGAAFDPAGKWGATQLMVSMLLRSSQRFSSQLIERELDEAGAEVGYEVTWDAIYFHGSAPPNSLERTLSLLAEMVVRPNFTEELFEDQRAELLARLKTGAARLEVRTEGLLSDRIFGPNPYAHSVQGTLETVEALELRDIIFQYRRLMLPNQARLALYFPGDRNVLFQRLSRVWGSWVKAEPAPFTFRPALTDREPIVVLVDAAADRAILRWGNLAVERSSSEFFALKVLEQYLILGIPDWAQQISSTSQIRASARLVARRMPGYFQISLKTDHATLLAYLDRLRHELGAIGQGSIHSDRLEEARRLVLQEYSASLKDPVSRLYRLLETELYGLGMNYIATFGLRLNRVTAPKLSQAAANYLSQKNFVLVVAGPVDKLRAALEKVAPVEVVP